MDDFTINVRQISQYPSEPVLPTDLVLLQAGLGGPYKQASSWGLVQGSTGLVLPPDNSGAGLVAAALGTPLYGPQGFNFYSNQQGGTSLFRNGAAGAWNFDGTTLSFRISLPGLRGQPIATWNTVLNITSGILEVPGSISVGRPPCEGMEVANADYVSESIAALAASLADQPEVTSFNSRNGDVQLTLDDILRAGGVPQVSPHFAGYPTAPTPFDWTQCNDVIATTAFVQSVLQNFVRAQGLVLSFNGRGGCVILTDADITAACTAPGAMPRSVTPPAGDASTRIATTGFVDNVTADLQSSIESDLDNYITQTEASLFAPINSPNFTGVPDAPTPAPGTNTGQLATTAFVHAAVVASTTGVASFNTRTGAVVLAGSDISAAGGALTTNPAFTGTPTAPTAVNGTNNTQLATTAFVMQELAVVGSGVTSFNTRSGVITLTLADVTATTVLANTPLTGIPTAPTAAPATSTTQLATTAFVAAAVAAFNAGVVTFNGRSGAVNLQAADVSAVGGAMLASPAFTGTPTAPTANPGTATTQLATTQFVMTQVASSGVASFNGRAGVVTLTAADITGAGGAVLASPAFTGVPTAPTAAPGTATTQLATTAFTAASGVRTDIAQSLTATQQTQGRQNIYAAPFDALAYNGMQINGSFDLSQELGFGTYTAGGYVCDGWSSGHAGTMVVTAAAANAGPTVPGGPNVLTMGVTTAQPSLGASDYMNLYHPIEGYRIARMNWGTANAQPITIAFWCKHFLPGTYSVAVQNAAQTRVYAAAYTQNVTGAFEYKTITIPGCVDGAWNVDNTVGIYLVFSFAAGSGKVIAPNAWTASAFSAVSAQVNAAAATANQCVLFGVIVLPGLEAPTAARAPFIMRPFDQELSLCQRYYEKTYPIGDAAGHPYGTAAGGGSFGTFVTASGTYISLPYWSFRVRKRVNPTVTIYSPFTGAAGFLRDQNGGADVAAANLGGACDGGAQIGVSNVAITANNFVWGHMVADARM